MHLIVLKGGIIPLYNVHVCVFCHVQRCSASNISCRNEQYELYIRTEEAWDMKADVKGLRGTSLVSWKPLSLHKMTSESRSRLGCVWVHWVHGDLLREAEMQGRNSPAINQMRLYFITRFKALFISYWVVLFSQWACRVVAWGNMLKGFVWSNLRLYWAVAW